MSNIDKLSGRIQSGIETVKKWDEDLSLLAECRRQIPFDIICPEQYHRAALSNKNNDNNDNADNADNDIDNDTSKTPINPYARDNDDQYEGDDLLLKRLTVFFQKSMTWVNNPSCVICGSTETKMAECTGPRTDDEREGGASRVERYHCPTCNTITTSFPRYNNPRALLASRQGRCGEYANLFGLHLRASGFETRYILDLTDHVWVEVWSVRQKRWIMADGCEGTIDEACMYEKGWGKKLSYVLGFGGEGLVVDVTRRYTRAFGEESFRGRRRAVCPGGDVQSDMIIAQVNASIRSSGTITATRMKELEQRDNLEQAFFRSTEIAGSWGKEEDYSEGRVSGSLAWRVSRGETGEVKKETEGGSNGDDDDGGGDGISSSTFYHVESFHPSPQYHNSNSSSSSSSGSSNCLITVTAPPFPAPSSYPDCIRISGVPCGAGLPKSISIVIIDEEHFCILQSRMFGDWRGAGRFLDTVPDGRVVAICAGVHLETNGMTDDGRRTLRKTLSRVGGLDLSVVTKTEQQQDNRHLSCVGQMNTLPTWAMCIYEDSAGGKTVSVEIDVDVPRRESSKNPLKLRCEDDTVPQTVSMRLPEDVMPLQTQLTATEEEKKEGFLRYYKKCNHEYVGYCTKKEAPVYLIKKTAFPLRKNGSGGARAAVASSKRSSFWRTYHFLPEPLVPEIIDIIDCDTPPALFDIPFNESFYNNLLGPNLLKNDGGGQQKSIDTMSALSKCRLVALYFSAHWCPPCRKFTPLLCEMYDHLKEIVPNHGLEIIFVSSDRDSGSFQQYFGTMPWLAVPLSNERKQRIGTTFGVQGIPAFVVLDTISGEVVVSKEHSRGEVTNACRGGNVSIEKMLIDDWLKRIPPESQMIMETLALSCEPQINNTNPKITPNSYLEKVHSSSNDTKTDVGDASVRIKAVFNELVQNGLQPNAAAAQAINQVAEEQARASNEVKLIPSMLIGKVEITHGGMKQEFPRNVSNSNVAKTAKQYLNNVRKNPYAFRFRSFKMSNKIFDRITSSTDGIEDVLNLGFSTYNNDTDFMACIPLGANLEGMNDTIEHFLSNEGAKENSGENEV